MEFKRFYDFYLNENSIEFHTYLPIQLDATCNGFQHMALLSNEDTLFKELNLISNSVKGKKISDDTPSDFYNFLLHRLTTYIRDKLSRGEISDKKKKGSYERLNNFIWSRSHVKKSIMTLPYNSSARSMKKYLAASLVRTDLRENDTFWYSASESQTKPIISDHDLYLLISSLRYIIDNDFEKIRKLTKYLKNIATILNCLGLPIVWTLPSGLTIKQSYLQTESTSITPFMHSKVKLNIKITQDNYDYNKQIRALMPNLIHSLDSTSLSLLYEQFIHSFNLKHATQFFSVHDCFGTTCEKVFTLKTLLASVYTDLYSSEPYLYRFDKYILDHIEANNIKLDRVQRKVEHNDKKYILHDVEWVMNKKHLSSLAIRRIDSQNIIL